MFRGVVLIVILEFLVFSTISSPSVPGEQGNTLQIEERQLRDMSPMENLENYLTVTRVHHIDSDYIRRAPIYLHDMEVLKEVHRKWQDGYGESLASEEEETLKRFRIVE